MSNTVELPDGWEPKRIEVQKQTKHGLFKATEVHFVDDDGERLRYAKAVLWVDDDHGKTIADFGRATLADAIEACANAEATLDDGKPL